MRSSTALGDLGGGVVVEARVRSGLVVGAPVLLDDDRGFEHREQRLMVETLFPEAVVKSLPHPILPRFARVDVRGCDARALQSPPDPVVYEFRAVVAPQILR